MSFIKIIGFAFLALSASMLFKRVKEEYSVFISVFAGISLTLTAFSILQPVTEYARSVSIPGSSGISVLIIKSAGVAIITTIASDICKDCGEASLGGKLELCGKALIMTLALPLIKNIFDGCLTLLG